jgi:hypothetical protein
MLALFGSLRLRLRLLHQSQLFGLHLLCLFSRHAVRSLVLEANFIVKPTHCLTILAAPRVESFPYCAPCCAVILNRSYSHVIVTGFLKVSTVWSHLDVVAA